MNDVLEELIDLALSGATAQAKAELQLEDGTRKTVRIIVVPEDFEAEEVVMNGVGETIAPENFSFKSHMADFYREAADLGDTEMTGLLDYYKEAFEAAFTYTGSMKFDKWLSNMAMSEEDRS